MALNRRTSKPRYTEPDGVLKLKHGIYQGVVRDNKDAQRMGRLRVFVPEFGGNPNNEGSWITVSYCSPFAGATNPEEIGNDPANAEESQNSYGFWMVPPDINSIVLIMFVNGDTSRGVWIGCLYQQFMNNMVPGIPASTSYSDGQVPTAEHNKKSARIDALREQTKRRPVLKEVRDALQKQGLLGDPIRGISTSGARRESPSEVYGISTPGPKRTNGRGRKGGSQFVMDDKEGEEKIRLRTRSGAQLLLDETNGLVYIINRDGTAWMQMDAEGNIDAYTEKSYTVRAEQDVNIHADNNINMFAGNNINMLSDKSFTLNSGQDFNIRGIGDVSIHSDAPSRGLKLQTGSAERLVAVDGTIVPRLPTHEPSPTHKSN